MRKTMIVASIAAAALIAMPAAAWTPASTSFALNGTVNGCLFNGTVVTNASGTTATVTAATLSGTPPFCAALFANFPYAMTALSTTSIKISNVLIQNGAVICQGNLLGSWNNLTGTMSFNAVLPGNGSLSCPIVGSVTTSPQLYM
ncbi:MAG: hypothetical protein P0Y59_20940 [Candidatus Sphingomonas phytovorans]|nr:hypothetical protein [Sphingomonas sp.]WEJ99362.1 MAG: hypothetical protein P0Y59_20940 [Sphingomonas sp.]